MSKKRDLPLVAGKIHGIRIWNVVWHRGELRLAASVTSSLWESGGTPTHAACDSSFGGGRHSAPKHDCSCGLYAYHVAREQIWGCDPALPTDEHLSNFEVGGVVEAWGTVELHQVGFRAEFARPLAFLLFKDAQGGDYEALVERLAKTHGAQVLRFEEPDELLRYCRAQQLGMDAASIAALVTPEVPATEEQPDDEEDQYDDEFEDEEEDAEDAPSSQRSYGSPPVPTPAPAERRPLWKRALEMLGTIVVLILGALSYGGIAAVVIFIAVHIINGDWDTKGLPPPTPRHLKIVEQDVAHYRGHDTYYAVVRNTSHSKTAFGVYTRGVFLGEGRGVVGGPGWYRTFTNRPTLAPGQEGVVIQALPHGRLRKPVKNFRMRAYAIHRPLSRSSPVDHLGVRVSDPGCRVILTARSSRDLPRPRIAYLGYRGDGTTLGPITDVVRFLRRGQHTYDVGKLNRSLCRDPGFRMTPYPNLAPRLVFTGN